MVNRGEEKVRVHMNVVGLSSTIIYTSELILCSTIFVQEVAKSSKDPYPPKTLNQIVSGIRRFMVEKKPAIEFNTWTLPSKGESLSRKFLRM